MELAKVVDIKDLDISKLQGVWAQIHRCLQAFVYFSVDFKFVQ